jgi:hypothetical protein
MKISEVQLGRSVRYPFYDIFALVQQRPNQSGLTIRLRRDRPAETRKSGIYVWHHPDWGYFYVGIAAADNFTERWNKHIQKLLDQCTSAKQMHNWREFATKFRTAGYGIDDLRDITLRFFPITTVADFGGDKEQLKNELKALETRIVSLINPACNREYDPARRSATRFPTQKPLKESSGYSLQGSFTPDLTKSKLWLIQELSKIRDRVSTVYILGAWFGNLSLYMKLHPAVKTERIINVEADPDFLKQSKRMLDHIGAACVDHMRADANDIDYRQLDKDGVVINTSLTDMDGREWYDNIPPGTLVALQARDHDPGHQFHSTADILRKFPLDVLYQGELDLEDPETKYTRFMVIGIKPNTP